MTAVLGAARVRYWCPDCGRYSPWIETTREQAETVMWGRRKTHMERHRAGKGGVR